MKKISELTNNELDALVAKAQRWTAGVRGSYEVYECWVDDLGNIAVDVADYSPSTNGGQAMELVKEFDVTINDFYVNGEPFIEVRCGTAETQIGVRNELEALACRSVIASHYGDEVPDDE